MKLYKRNVKIRTKDNKIIKRNVYKQVTGTDNLGSGLIMSTIRLVARYNNQLWEVKGILGMGKNKDPKLVERITEEV